MKLKDKTLSALRALAQNNEDVAELMKFYDFVTSNQVYESYVARKITLDRWNEDLIKHPVALIVGIIDDATKFIIKNSAPTTIHHNGIIAFCHLEISV